MSPPMLPLVEVTRRALAILTRELGAADTLRFVGQFTTGSGDYTADRDQLFAGQTLAGIVADIKATRATPPAAGQEPAAP